MPEFSSAKIVKSASGALVDLTPYLKLLQSNDQPGSRIILPLEQGDRSRVIMRNMNRAADQSGMRIRRSLPGTPNAIDIVVMNPEKRSLNLTDEQRAERGAKIKAARMANRT
jgi:hypothetical protein